MCGRMITGQSNSAIAVLSAPSNGHSTIVYMSTRFCDPNTTIRCIRWTSFRDAVLFSCICPSCSPYSPCTVADAVHSYISHAWKRAIDTHDDEHAEHVQQALAYQCGVDRIERDDVQMAASLFKNGTPAMTALLIAVRFRELSPTH